MPSLKQFYSLRVNAASSPSPQHTKKMRSRIYYSMLIVFSAAVVLTLVSFAARFVWHKLYIKNDRLTLKYIDFKGTRHYMAYPTHGYVDFQTILEGMNIRLNVTNLLSIHLDDVQQHLKLTNPLLKNIAISKILPDTLRIEASEHVPVAFFVTKNAQGSVMNFPVAVYKHLSTPAESYSLILLPVRLDLFHAKKNMPVSWNYALYSAPFDNRSISGIMPILFNFNATVSKAPEDQEQLKLYRPFVTPGSCYPGQIIVDNSLSNAVKFIELLGISSANNLFTIQQLTFIPPNTLRALVDPMPKCRKIQPSSIFDFDCNGITPALARNLMAFLNNCEKDDRCRQIRYLCAAEHTMFSSPEPYKEPKAVLTPPTVPEQTAPVTQPVKQTAVATQAKKPAAKPKKKK